MGPTAAGKTAVAMTLAERFPVDVISVDSTLVYRGMDIGTAKPTADELALVPHRLIDLLDPTENYSAGAFCRDALAAMREIAAADRIPLLVGGTMLYFQALQRGLAELPDADPALRAELDARAAREGWPALHAELEKLDPATAARVQPTDAQRIQRALEVCILADEPMSILQAQTAPPLAAKYLNIGLLPSDRGVLHARIEQRLQQMVVQGFSAEVEQLLVMPGVGEHTAALRAVGYRQFLPLARGEIELDEALQKAIIATRQLAKRQLTWLRSWPDLHAVDCLEQNCAEQVGSLVEVFLNSRASAGISR